MGYEQTSRAWCWKPRTQSLVTAVLVFSLSMACALSVLSCAPTGAPIDEAQYAAKLDGSWQGTVGDVKESMTFGADGKFVSKVRPLGFISNTLGQGVTETIRGTWTIRDKVITLKITSSDNEHLLNQATSSTIVAFKQDELVVRSAGGETSTFRRAATF